MSARAPKPSRARAPRQRVTAVSVLSKSRVALVLAPIRADGGRRRRGRRPWASTRKSTERFSQARPPRARLQPRTPWRGCSCFSGAERRPRRRIRHFCQPTPPESLGRRTLPDQFFTLITNIGGLAQSDHRKCVIVEHQVEVSVQCPQHSSNTPRTSYCGTAFTVAVGVTGQSFRSNE